MQNVSNFDAIYQEGNFETHYKVNIDGVDYGEDVVWSMKTSRRLFTENTNMIGNAMIGMIDLTIFAPSVTFSRMAKVKPYVRLYSKTRRMYSGWAQKGEFYIDTRPKDEADGIETMDITGYDAMRKANQKYPSSTLSWSKTSPTTYQVVNEIARTIGVNIDSRTITKLQATPYIVAFPAQYTMAEVLGSIAAMYGGNFCISDTGRLMLVGLMDLPEETYLLVNEKGNYITFGGVRIKLKA